MEYRKQRQLTWIGSSLDDLKSFPKVVQREVGFTLHRVQEGKTPGNTKPLKGLGAGVMEIISDYNKGTYRAVYAVKLGDDIYPIFQTAFVHYANLSRNLTIFRIM